MSTLQTTGVGSPVEVGYVYFIETEDKKFIKIGYSTKPVKRAGQLGTLMPVKAGLAGGPRKEEAMKALTVKQPWASLIVAGAKDVENRDWLTTYTGIVAIHSSTKMSRVDMDDACEFMKSFIPNFSTYRFKQDAFPTGAILGTVEIVDCVKASDSPWFVGAYGFLLQNAVRFAQPIPCKGALGFWSVPDEVVVRCREEYRLACGKRRKT